MESNFWTTSANICEKYNAMLCMDGATYKIEDVSDLHELNVFISLDRLYIAFKDFPSIRIEPFQRHVAASLFWDMSFYDIMHASLDRLDLSDVMLYDSELKPKIKRAFSLMKALRKYWRTVKAKEVPELPLED